MSSSGDKKLILADCKAWIEKFVIALNICPFAGPSFLQDKIVYSIVESQNESVIIESFLLLLSTMIEKTDLSNGFLILSETETFEKYLDFYYTCEELLEESGTDQLFQLASFHPNYQYDGLEFDDQANYRNRSPNSMIHILRVSEVEKVIEQHRDTLEIPKMNAEKLRSMSKSELMDILKSTSRSYG